MRVEDFEVSTKILSPVYAPIYFAVLIIGFSTLEVQGLQGPKAGSLSGLVRA